MSQTLGTAVLELTTDATALERGLAQAEKQASNFGRAAALAIAGVGAAVTAASGLTVKTAADFESAIAGIKAVSGATNEQIQKVSNLALQLGKDTVFSAKEAADGIQELVKGGVSLDDVLNGAAKATLNLAAAGGIDLPDAATIAANALAIFNLHGKDMAHVADLIAGAANASAIDVRDFQFAMQMSGAVAAQTGQSFDDLAQAIAVMGQQGLRGSDAGTSLKTMLLRLVPQTKEAADEMRKLGIITADGSNLFVDAQGHFRSMAEIAQVLQEHTAGLTDAERTMALQTIFGTDAIRAAAILAKEGGAGFREMADAMGKVTAESVAQTRLDTFNGSMEQLKGSVETLMITVGTIALPYLRQFVDRLTDLVNAAIPWVQEHGPAIAATMQQVGAFLRDQVLPPLTQFIANLWTLLTTVIIPWVQANGPAFLATLQQIGTIIATQVVPAVVSFLQSLAPVVTFIAANIQPILAGLAAMLVAVAVPAFIAWAVAATTAAVATITALAPVILPIVAIGAAVGLLYAAWQSNFLGIQDVTASVFLAIQTVIQTILNALIPFILSEVQVVTDWWTANHALIEGTAQAVWNAIQAVISFVMPYIQALIQGVLTQIQADWSIIWTLIQGVLTFTWNTMKVVIDTTLKNILSLITIALDLLHGNWQGAWNEVKAILQRTWDAVKELVRLALDFVGGTLITPFLNALVPNWQGAWQKIKDFFVSTWQGIVDTAKGAINHLLDLLNRLIGAWNKLSFHVPGFSATVEVPFKGPVSFGWPGIDIGTQDIAPFPLLDAGGIVTAPTLAMLAANSRPEAVIPLDQVSGLIDYERLALTIVDALATRPTFQVNATYRYQDERSLRDDVRLLQMLR